MGHSSSSDPVSNWHLRQFKVCEYCLATWRTKVFPSAHQRPALCKTSRTTLTLPSPTSPSPRRLPSRNNTPTPAIPRMLTQPPLSSQQPALPFLLLSTNLPLAQANNNASSTSSPSTLSYATAIGPPPHSPKRGSTSLALHPPTTDTICKRSGLAPLHPAQASSAHSARSGAISSQKTRL